MGGPGRMGGPAGWGICRCTWGPTARTQTAPGPLPSLVAQLPNVPHVQLWVTLILLRNMVAVGVGWDSMLMLSGESMLIGGILGWSQDDGVDTQLPSSRDHIRLTKMSPWETSRAERPELR